MPAEKTPFENEDSVMVLRQDATCGGCRRSRHLMRSSASMCTISTIVLRERPVSEVHPRLARELRGVNSADREDSNVNIDRLNYLPGIQKMCNNLSMQNSIVFALPLDTGWVLLHGSLYRSIES